MNVNEGDGSMIELKSGMIEAVVKLKYLGHNLQNIHHRNWAYLSGFNLVL